jgi:hypothetical protein
MNENGEHEPCVGCAVLREELAIVRAERKELMDRLMAALSPPAYQAFQGVTPTGAGTGAPINTVVDAQGQVWVEVGGKLVSQADWQKLAQGAVYLDEAGRAVPAEEVDRAMDKLGEMLGGGKT